jgi:hypothetical protein
MTTLLFLFFYFFIKDATARFNQRTGCNVSSRTVCRRLFWEGYNRRVVSKKITISQVNRQRRVWFCRPKLHWTGDQWADIIILLKNPESV